MRYTFCNIIRWVTVWGTLFASNTYAQIEMGGWKTAFSYNGISQVIQTKTRYSQSAMVLCSLSINKEAALKLIPR